jgi:hypothetical protein
MQLATPTHLEGKLNVLFPVYENPFTYYDTFSTEAESDPKGRIAHDMRRLQI